MTTPSLQDCFTYDRSLMPFREARRRLRAAATCRVGTETVALDHAVGRVLATPLTSSRDVPGFDNVAVDGWAFAMPEKGLNDTAGLEVQAGRAAAGHPFSGKVSPGQVLRVLTGARMPEGTDTVALQEEVALEDGRVRLPAALRRGANRRRRGEDVACGATILETGHILRPQDIGIAAELGEARIEVFKELKIAILSCGDEVHEPGSRLAEGGLFDANRPMLKSFLARLPVAVTDLGILPDDAATVRHTLAAAAGSHDLILASGGASQGDEDHIVRAIADRGSMHFWRIALKPGRPLGIGELDRALVIGLPGNPVAAMVCSLVLARPMILSLAGAAWKEPRAAMLPSAFSMKKHAGRREYVRGRLESGRLQRVARQGSGILTSLVEADGLIELDDDLTSVRPGDLLPFLSFEELGI